MTHDPMCLWWESKPEKPVAEDCMMCNLIAKVRSDERQQAAVRVEKNVLVGMTLIPKEVRMVLDAVRGES